MSIPCGCDCGDYVPVFNDEVITYNPIFGQCGDAVPSDSTIVIFDGGDVDGYDD